MQADESAAHLTGMLHQAAEQDSAALVVGPPPVADAEHNQRIKHLDSLFRTGCREAAVSYVSVFDPLLGDEAWSTEVQRSDGAHPAARGYHHAHRPDFRSW